MEYLDNPAGRLLGVIETARRVTPAETPAIAGWSKVFGVPDGDLRHLLICAADLLGLARQTRQIVEAMIEDDPDVILEHFSQVDNMLENFKRVGQMQLSQFLEPLDIRSGQHSLKLCASLLHRKCAEPELTSDKISELRQKIEDLIVDVEEVDDLDPATKMWVLSVLGDIQDSLSKLNIRGTSELRSVADKLAGGLLGKRDRIASVSKSKIRDKLIGFIVALDLALNIAANLSQLTDGAEPTPSPAIEIIQQTINLNVDTPALPSGSSSGIVSPEH